MKSYKTGIVHETEKKTSSLGKALLFILRQETKVSQSPHIKDA